MLIIEESGDEMSDGNGKKSEALFSLFPSHHSPLPAVRSFPSSPSRASRFTPALAFLACSRFVLSIKPWERLWRRQMGDKVIMLLSPVTFSLRLSCNGGLEDCRQIFVSF